MKPRRPDSAKSHVTKITQDSDFSKKDLNVSKFSETFSSGVNSTNENGDSFKQYVEEKNKDPRFKHLKSKLEVIQQKNPPAENTKTNFKPFQKKKDKTIEKNGNKKIEEKTEKIQKEEEQLTLSRGFAEKNKQKFNSLKPILSQKQEEEKLKETIKSKIKFDAFRINKPGEKRQSKKAIDEQKKEQVAQKQKQEEKVEAKSGQAKKKQKTQEQIKREIQFRELQRFVNDVETRNIMNFPSHYDQFVNSAVAENAQDLAKINLNDFMSNPTEGDYEQLKAKINKMDTQLNDQKAEESIDLQSLIQSQEREKEEEQASQMIYASMSASDMKKRNAFITEILSGKLSKNQIDKLQNMERSSMRMYKLQHEKQEEDESELSQINVVKRKNNRLMQRNRLEAAGQLYRDCDYLSQEHQKRIQQLLNGDIGQSPFECSEFEAIRRRNIDEGIRMYRQMSDSTEINGDIINEQSLPKDPQLRKQAEKKVLKEKITNINQRLSQVDKVVVTKAKIEALLKKFEHTRTSSNYQQIYQQNQQKFQSEMKMLAEAQEMLKGLNNKQNIDEVMDEIQAKYRQIQSQIRRFTQMDEKELMRMQKQKLKAKMRQVEGIQKEAANYDHEIQEIQKIKRQIQQNLRVFDLIEDLHAPSIQCQGYTEAQTLQDIDAVITKKWQSQLAKPIQNEKTQ